jgi:hypothetical protein
MTLEEAAFAASINGRVLMCYETEDEMINDMLLLEHITGSRGESHQGKYSFDGGGSIRFITIKLTTSEHWGSLHFDEGNALAREIFPGCFTDAL